MPNRRTAFSNCTTPNGRRGDRWRAYQNRLNQVPIDPDVTGPTFQHVVEEAAKKASNQPMSRVARQIVSLSFWPPNDDFKPVDLGDIRYVFGKRRDKQWQAALSAIWSKTLQMIRRSYLSDYRL